MQPSAARRNAPFYQQQQQHDPTGATESANMSTTTTTNHQQQWRKQQWDAKVASFQRGLAHVLQCSAGGACGSSLCHATRRLMRTYATHDCTDPGAAADATDCKVCKLWSFMLKSSNTHMGQTPLILRRPLGELSANACGRIHAARVGVLGSSGPSSAPSRRRRIVATPELVKILSKRV